MKIFRSKDLFVWGPNDGAPLTVHYSAFPGVREIKDDYGVTWPKGVMTFNKDKMTWFNDMKELNRHGEEFVRKLILDEKEKKKTLALWKRKIKELEQVHKEIEGTDLSGLSDKSLMALFKRFSKVYYGFWGPGMLAEPVNFGAEKMLREEIEKIAPKEKLNDVLGILCAPTKLSFYAREEKDLLQITKELRNQKKDILQGRYDFRKNKRLEKHVEGYFWMLNNYYETRYLDEGYFGSIIKKWLEEDVDEDGKIKEMEDHVKESAKKKKDLIKKHKFSKYVAKLSGIIDEFMLFQDERKKYNLKAMHYLDMLIAELGRRVGIEMQDMKYLLPEEIFELFERQKEFKNLIKQRKEICVIVYENREYNVLDQKSAKEAYDWLFELEIKDSDEIKGIIANKGYAKGKVCLMLSIREISRMKQGEVLVTTMTTPDFVVAMKKASAIVTDQGGLTSHAAIVSRELKIPCIVGTKIATKVIKDGDLVEVDADKGIIKILR